MIDCRKCPKRHTCKGLCREILNDLPALPKQPNTVTLYGDQLEKAINRQRPAGEEPPAPEIPPRIPTGALSPRQHLALQLLVDGYDLNSISELLQTPEPSVRRLLLHAKIKLAKHLRT